MAYWLPPQHEDEDYTQYPSYDYEVDLGDYTYRVVMRWRERQGAWYLDLYDSDGEALKLSHRMVVDYPLLASNTDRAPDGGVLMLVDTSGAHEECGYQDLGRRCQLLWIASDELDPESATNDYTITIS